MAEVLSYRAAVFSACECRPCSHAIAGPCDLPSRSSSGQLISASRLTNSTYKWISSSKDGWKRHNNWKGKQAGFSNGTRLKVRKMNWSCDASEAIFSLDSGAMRSMLKEEELSTSSHRKPLADRSGRFRCCASSVTGKDRPYESDESDAMGSIAAAAKAATLAVEESTNEIVYNFEKTLPIDRNAAPGEQSSPLNGASSGLQDEAFLKRAARAEDSDAVLDLIVETQPGSQGVLTNEDCARLILDAIAQKNVELAFSVLRAMRTSSRRSSPSQQGAGARGGVWKWPPPDVTTYIALARGFATSLRVADAIQIVSDVKRRGVPLGDEVPFGEVVNCPKCKISLAVVQPQQGAQVVPCSKCRYKYELWSGSIMSCESEVISSDASFLERGLRLLPFVNSGGSSVAVHSVVVQAPDGRARTLRFATESDDVPAKEGDRVTVVLASSGKVGRGYGPIRFNARTPGWQPQEPMGLNNHVTGLELNLRRAPPKAGSGASFDFSVVLPAAIIFAGSDAASGLIDPSLPRLITVGTAVALTLGGASKVFLLPKLNQLPERTVEAVGIRQRLLSQYERLQEKLTELVDGSANEVRMLARMCQLENKMEAVGEVSYGARIERVRKAREGLEERLSARLELMDSYAKVASMIEIEVEMDVDVLAAEAASPEATIAEQIESLMDVERLQKEWKNQAEANDEVERLLRVPYPESA